jgi:hypothetical protein
VRSAPFSRDIKTLPLLLDLKSGAMALSRTQMTCIESRAEHPGRRAPVQRLTFVIR